MNAPQTPDSVQRPQAPAAPLPQPGGLRGWLSRRAPLLWFGVSGVLALGVDMGVLAWAQPSLGHYGGRALSFWAAASFTWWFNRVVTFARARALASAQTQAAGGASRPAWWREYLRYFASMVLGGSLNCGAYAAAVALVPLVHAHPQIGVALGSLVGTAFNFVAARRVLVR